MSSLKKELPAILILATVCLYSVWPMVANRNLITNIGSDGLLLTWIMNQPLWSWQGNVFYPHKNVLGYSDMHKVSGLVSGGNFATAMILGQIATMMVVYLWWRRWGMWPAAVGVVVLAVSQIRFEYQVHLQMWSMQYWLLGSWLVGSWFTDNKNWKLFLGSILLGLQIYESPLPLLFAVAILIAQGLMLKTKINEHVLLAGLMFLAIVFPAVRVYVGVSREFNFVRDIREAAHNSISVDDLWGHFWSPGLIILLVVALLHSAHFRPPLNLREGIKEGDTAWLWAILLIGLIMALGPVLKWQDKTVKLFGKYFVPLPYGIVYHAVPGMGGFRTPSRWLWLSAFASSGLIAYGFKDINYKKGVLLLGVAIIGGSRLTNVMALPEIPKVYQWLKDQPGKIVLEAPVFTWPQEAIETQRMYFSLYHGKTLVNGYSGFTPPLVFRLAADWKNNIPPGVDYIISHDPQIKYPKPILYADEKNTVYSAR